MNRRGFDIQVLVVLLFVLAIFLAALFIRVVENPLGLFSEPNELVLYGDDLQGLRERAELRCRGAVVGHVKTIQWGTRVGALGSMGQGPVAHPLEKTESDGPKRFWIRAGISNRYNDWKFSSRGHIQGAVMQSAVTPSWIELAPVTASDPPAPPGSLAEIELLPEKQKPGAEGLVDKVTELGDALLEVVHVLNPPPKVVVQSDPGASGPVSSEPTATSPIQKIVKVIDDMSQTSRSLREFAIRLQEKSTDEELNKALQELKTAVAKLHKHVNDADGAVEETKAAMIEFRRAAKATDLSAAKFDDLVDRIGDTTLGRVLIRKKNTQKAASPTPRPR